MLSCPQWGRWSRQRTCLLGVRHPEQDDSLRRSLGTGERADRPLRVSAPPGASQARSSRSGPGNPPCRCPCLTGRQYRGRPSARGQRRRAAVSAPPRHRRFTDTKGARSGRAASTAAPSRAAPRPAGFWDWLHRVTSGLPVVGIDPACPQWRPGAPAATGRPASLFPAEARQAAWVPRPAFRAILRSAPSRHTPEFDMARQAGRADPLSSLQWSTVREATRLVTSSLCCCLWLWILPIRTAN
jgi:hypothetical protein